MTCNIWRMMVLMQWSSHADLTMRAIHSTCTGQVFSRVMMQELNGIRELSNKSVLLYVGDIPHRPSVHDESFMTFTTSHEFDGFAHYLIPTPYEYQFENRRGGLYTKIEHIVKHSKQLYEYPYVFWRGAPKYPKACDRHVNFRNIRDEVVALSGKLLNASYDDTSFTSFLKYKYLLDVGGSSCTTYDALRWKLASGRVVLRIVLPSSDWIDRFLAPWFHYVPVRHDHIEEDIVSVTNMLNANASDYLRISQNAMSWGRSPLRTMQNFTAMVREISPVPATIQKKYKHCIAGCLNNNIWLYWRQGWSNVPSLVRAVSESWMRHNPTWHVIMLDRDNYTKYMDTSHICHKKSACDHIPDAAFSDILRLHLMSSYGGVWADATVWCNRPLDEWVHSFAAKTQFFMYRSRHDPNNHLSQTIKIADALPGKEEFMRTGNIGQAYGSPCSWFMVSYPDSYIASTWNSRVISYWKHRKWADDIGGLRAYFWLDGLFFELLASDRWFRKQWALTSYRDAYGSYNSSAFWVQTDKWTDDKILNDFVYKLSWKTNYSTDSVACALMSSMR